MNISFIDIQNFRKLKKCRINFSNTKTLFVGANNSGKTSAMDALGKFLANRNCTTRLFYVACTRAQKSLAVIAYTHDQDAVKKTAMSNGWFMENEIRPL